MLRRRHKTPKPGSAREAAGGREGGTARTPRSRRRAREDAPVPPDLKIKPHHATAQAQKPQPVESKPPKPAPQLPLESKPHKPAPQPPLESKPHKPAPQPPPESRPHKPAPQPPRDTKQEKPAPHKPAPPAQHRGAASERRSERKPHGGQVVLVTGFEPFDADDTNPSWEICTRLPREIEGLRVEVCRVPCEFRRAIEVVAAAIETHEPAIVLCLGLASGRTHMGVERIAINCDDARIPDNAGVQPIDQPVAANGPPAYFATVPVKAMVAAMHDRDVPAEVSNTAGTFVCNHLMYGVLHFLSAKGHGTRAGFIHVPRAEGMALHARGVASMSLATMTRGVEAAIAAAHAHSEDIAAAGGSLD
jgi:pyroglutamyl-peptidase